MILCGLILFGFFLVSEQGYIALTLESDRSHISSAILTLYALLSAHWLYLVLQLSTAQRVVDETQPHLEAAAPGELRVQGEEFCINSHVLPTSDYADYLKDLAKKSRYVTPELDQGILLEALSERLMAKHAFGHFASDMLLKLGLLGTIIGFIMMLAPVGELRDFDPNVLQQLLGQMSGGMAVALFTTISGLVTSTLLGLQYQLLDAASVRFVDRIAVSVDVLVLPLLAAQSRSS